MTAMKKTLFDPVVLDKLMKVEVENEIIKPLLAEEGKPVHDMSSTDFYINSFFEVFWKHCRICSKVNSVQPTQRVYLRLLENNYFSGKTANPTVDKTQLPCSLYCCTSWSSQSGQLSLPRWRSTISRNTPIWTPVNWALCEFRSLRTAPPHHHAVFILLLGKRTFWLLVWILLLLRMALCLVFNSFVSNLIFSTC